MRPLVLEEEEEVVVENGSKKTLTTTKSVPMSSGNKKQQVVNPFSRKDLFYQGSSSALLKASNTKNNTVSEWDDFRHLLFTTTRYEYLKDLH